MYFIKVPVGRGPHCIVASGCCWSSWDECWEKKKVIIDKKDTYLVSTIYSHIWSFVIFWWTRLLDFTLNPHPWKTAFRLFSGAIYSRLVQIPCFRLVQKLSLPDCCWSHLSLSSNSFAHSKQNKKISCMVSCMFVYCPIISDSYEVTYLTHLFASLQIKVLLFLAVLFFLLTFIGR